jgi:hypothetical protein
MITTTTVLILGAGASMHLDFPSGRKLKSEILDFLQDKWDPQYETMIQLGNDESKIKNFSGALYKSGKASVDAFLENRFEYLHIGKQAMALALMKYEDPIKLFKANGNWYNYLFEKMDSSMNSWGQNALSIITFNYDRSIDSFLFTAVVNSFGVTNEVASKMMENIPIIHFYGNLGDLDWQSQNGRSFSNKYEIEDIRNAAKSIRVIHEGDPIDTTLLSTKSILSNAQRIIFLGFGYNETNLIRLGFEKNDNYKNSSIYGSCYDFTKLEKQNLINRFKPRSIHLGSPLSDIEYFLRDDVSL